MPRRRRIGAGGYVYHVLNRGAGRMTLFRKDGDYEAFIRVMQQTAPRVPGLELFCYCLMPNHWHLLLRPRADGELSEFMRLLTVTHTQRWHAHRCSAGTGPVYQGRFKSFPVQDDGHFLTVARYVEQNPLRADLIERVEDWPWTSLAARRGLLPERAAPVAGWPNALGVPKGWLRTVNTLPRSTETDVVRRCVVRGRPLGDADWTAATVERLELMSTLQPRGRPRRPLDD
ncbi:MAG: transposase [Planctomycetota bacterium]